MTDRWIYAHNWEKWQSGRRQEGAPWIRNYGALLHDDEYLDLTISDRAVLHGLWMLLGETGNGRLLFKPVRISHQLSLDRGTVVRTLKRLNDAGWISFECTKNGHGVYTEEIREDKNPPTPRRTGGKRSSKKTSESRPNGAAYAPPDLDLPDNPIPKAEIAAMVKAMTATHKVDL